MWTVALDAHKHHGRLLSPFYTWQRKTDSHTAGKRRGLGSEPGAKGQRVQGLPHYHRSFLMGIGGESSWRRAWELTEKWVTSGARPRML